MPSVPFQRDGGLPEAQLLESVTVVRDNQANNNYILETGDHPDYITPGIEKGRKKNLYTDVVSRLRQTFQKGITKPYEFRIKQLKQLRRMCKDCGPQLIAALAADLKKNKFESHVCEIDIIINEIDYFIMNLKQWMKPEKPHKDPSSLMDKVLIHNNPRGVVLIIGAWNYPIQLNLMPIIGAIAAGNCFILKPSEVSPASSNTLFKLLPLYLDNMCYQVVLGSVEETTQLLRNRFDYIFYTGSTSVGKIVRAAANEYLTPVTLEMGGKSPVFLDSTADMKIAVRRILWGKCLNAGQTCIAPDYLLCTKEVQDSFLSEAKEVLFEWYGINTIQSPDLCRIINEAHYNRLKVVLRGADIAIGGQMNDSEKFISPTVVINTKLSDAVMQEEIFGPILPILTVKNVQEAIELINERESPLTMYVFSKDENIQKLFINTTTSGSICINDTITQFIVDTLPFGGIGNSGMGAYHGKYTFDTFTHKKSCLIKDYNPILEKIASQRYPPYNDKKLQIMQCILKKRKQIKCTYMPFLVIFVLGLLFGIFMKSYSENMDCSEL